MVMAFRNHPRHHHRSSSGGGGGDASDEGVVPSDYHNGDYAGGGESGGRLRSRSNLHHHQGGTGPSNHHLDSNNKKKKKKKNRAESGSGILAMVKRSLGGAGGYSTSSSVPTSITTPQTSFSSSGHSRHPVYPDQPQQQQPPHQQQQQCNNQNMMAQQPQHQHQHERMVAHTGQYQYHTVVGGGSGAAPCDVPSSYPHYECQQTQQPQQEQEQRRRTISSYTNHQKLMQQQQPQQPPPPGGRCNRRTDCAVSTATTTTTTNTPNPSTGVTSATTRTQHVLGATDIGNSAQAGVRDEPRRNTYPTKSYSSRLFEQQQQQQSIVRARTIPSLSSSSSSSHHHHHSNFTQTKPMKFNDVWDSCDGVLMQQLQQQQTSSRFHNVPISNRALGGKNKINMLLLGRSEDQQQQTQQRCHPQANDPTRQEASLRNGGVVEGGGNITGDLPPHHGANTPITLQDLSRTSMVPLRSFSKHQSCPPLPPPRNNVDGERGEVRYPTTSMQMMYYGSLAAARAHANQRRASTGQQYPRSGGGEEGGMLPPNGGMGGMRRNTVQSPSASPMNSQASTTQPQSAMIGACQDKLSKPHNFDGGEVTTIVHADVQGWTSFWEVCSSDSMQKAVDIYDRIMRQCYTETRGYEIKAEGGVFHIAFRQPVDALLFALQAQLKLYEANWPEGITMHDDGKKDPALKLHGFRVKISIHQGPVIRRVHDTTGRTIYSGEAVEIVNAVEKMCHGGQILTTIETWNTVCDHGMAERCLGRPQVVDCGEHFLFKTKTNHLQPGGGTSNKCTRRIMQLVPNELSFDYFEARGRRDVPPSTEDGQIGYEIKNSLSVHGRLFPPLNSKRQLTTCFLNAPYANGRVTICFVYTVGLDDHDGNPSNQATNLGILAKQIRKQLLMIDPPGYECREDNGCWMIAFDTMANAVNFGLAMKSILLRDTAVADSLMGNANCNAMFKIGIVSGPFTSMGPHKTTGKADYFGPIVNRAMQVASNCIPGEVVVGIPLSNGATVADSPHFGPTINVTLQGIKKLVGVELNVAMFACSRNIDESLP